MPEPRLTHRLQRVTTRIGDKEYQKYQLIIPTKLVEQLGWGKEQVITFDANLRTNQLVLKQGTPPLKPLRMSYDVFRQTIFWQLVNGPTTYSEMLAKAPGLPKSPNPEWVRRIERQYPTFKRQRDKKTLRMIWSYSST